jgi:hypothetical protein
MFHAEGWEGGELEGENKRGGEVRYEFITYRFGGERGGNGLL